jgi:hypothetical protein
MYVKIGVVPLNEHKALMKAELDVSKEYHISLFDIKKLVKA